MGKLKTKDLFLNAVRQKPSNALNEIRDRCLLLILANEYLCERVFLYRMGGAIVSYAEALRGEISALKKRFPGKFIHEIETDKIVADIKTFGESLKKGDRELKKKCASGQLGRELEEKINILSRAIHAITELVEGGSVSYSSKDSLTGLWGWTKSVMAWIWSSTTLISKVLVFTVLIAMIAVYFLFVTMEQEDDYQKLIQQASVIITTQEQVIVELEQGKKALVEQIVILQGPEKNPGDKEKLEILGLNLKIEDLEQKKKMALVEIDVQKSKVEENQKIVEAISRKNFWQRLLRR